MRNDMRCVILDMKHRFDQKNKLCLSLNLPSRFFLFDYVLQETNSRFSRKHPKQITAGPLIYPSVEKERKARKRLYRASLSRRTHYQQIETTVRHMLLLFFLVVLIMLTDCISKSSHICFIMEYFHYISMCVCIFSFLFSFD